MNKLRERAEKDLATLRTKARTMKQNLLMDQSRPRSLIASCLCAVRQAGHLGTQTYVLYVQRSNICTADPSDPSAHLCGVQHEKELAAAAEAADAAAAKLAEQETAAAAEAAKGADAAERARTAAIEALQAEQAAALQAVKVLHHARPAGSTLRRLHPSADQGVGSSALRMVWA